MRQSCMCCMNKTAFFLMMLAVSAAPLSFRGTAFGVEKQRDPVILRVVTVNPSEGKTQETPIRIDLPAEVTPKDVIDAGDLKVEYDEDRRIYYVFKEKVSLAPTETRVFEVVVKDLWFVPQEKMDNLKNYTQMVLGRLEKTQYADSAHKMADSIFARLSEIETVQNDESLGRKARIGNFRHHTQTLAEIKEDLARMEKLLTFTGGPPVPEMLEESKLKSDAPSRTTTWAVIFLILIFLGLLGGQFFFTWQRKAKMTQESAAIREAAFSILQKPAKESRISTTQVPEAAKETPARPGSSIGTHGPGTSPRAGP